MFLDDLDGGSDCGIERTEFPTGVETIITKCYVRVTSTHLWKLLSASPAMLGLSCLGARVFI